MENRNEIKKLQKIPFGNIKNLQLEILNSVHIFCVENDINYIIDFGTLLGAARHKGFIPWDDDIDISMLRPDFDKFSQLYKDNQYSFYNIDNDKSFPYAFGRVYNTQTISFLHNKIKKGIYIDVYPLDGIPSEEKLQKKVFSKIDRLQKLGLFWYSILNGLCKQRLWIRNSLVFTPLLLKIRKIDIFCRQFPIDSSEFVTSLTTVDYARKLYYKKWFDEKIDLEFEGYIFKAPKEYDKWLKLIYGDYMKFPPEDDRHPKHASDYYWINNH